MFCSAGVVSVKNASFRHITAFGFFFDGKKGIFGLCFCVPGCMSARTVHSCCRGVIVLCGMCT